MRINIAPIMTRSQVRAMADRHRTCPVGLLVSPPAANQRIELFSLPLEVFGWFGGM
jgi:hypothetical protein